MLSKISWGQFALTAAILLLLYYLFIGATIYRKKLLDFFNRRPAVPKASQTETPTAQRQPEMPTDIVLIERVLQELRWQVLPQAGQHPTKEKLLIVFGNYLTGLQSQNLLQPVKIAINQLIAKEAAQQCDIYIDPAEIAALW